MRLKNLLLTGSGFLLIAMAAIGLFLPLWPTTPFALLAVGCFSRNPALQARLMRIRFIREHVENYRNRNGLPGRTVAVSLAFLWSMLILSMVLIRRPWITLLLAAIGVAVTLHILCIARPKRRGGRIRGEEPLEGSAPQSPRLGLKS